MIATYNLSHANKHVAKLKLPRSNYRLGDSVVGVLDLKDAELCCYHVSIILESLERVEPAFALRPMREIMRNSARRHADAHMRCHGRRRVAFELWAPSWGTSDFETTVGRGYFGTFVANISIARLADPPAIHSRQPPDRWSASTPA